MEYLQKYSRVQTTESASDEMTYKLVKTHGTKEGWQPPMIHKTSHELNEKFRPTTRPHSRSQAPQYINHYNQQFIGATSTASEEKLRKKLRSHKYNSTDKLTVEWPTHCTRPRIYVVKQYQWAVVWAHVDSSLLFAAGHPSPTAIACCQVRSMNRLRLIDCLGNANVSQSKPMRTQVY